VPVSVYRETPTLVVMRSEGENTFDGVRAAMARLLSEELAVGPETTIFIDSRGTLTAFSNGLNALMFEEFKRVFARGVSRLGLLSDSEIIHERSQMFAAFAYSIGVDARCFLDTAKAREWVESNGAP
jgi:hypothetical protein